MNMISQISFVMSVNNQQVRWLGPDSVYCRYTFPSKPQCFWSTSEYLKSAITLEGDCCGGGLQQKLKLPSGGAHPEPLRLPRRPPKASATGGLAMTWRRVPGFPLKAGMTYRSGYVSRLQWRGSFRVSS